MKLKYIILLCCILISGCSNTNINPSGTINSEGRMDVVQHSHPNSGTIHLHRDNLGAAKHRFILIDLNDTVGYPHSEVSYAHLEWLQVQVDASVNAAYTINLGFIENVTATDSTEYVVKHWSGSKQAGTQLLLFESPYPNGWEMQHQNVATGERTFNYSDFNSTVGFNSTLDNLVIPDDGDVFLEVYITAGTVDLSFDAGYHTD